MFRRTLQQDKWYKEGAYINCGKQGYFAKNYKDGQYNYIVKGTRLPECNNIDTSVLRGTKECLINYFAYYYNNVY